MNGLGSDPFARELGVLGRAIGLEALREGSNADEAALFGHSMHRNIGIAVARMTGGDNNAMGEIFAIHRAFNDVEAGGSGPLFVEVIGQPGSTGYYNALDAYEPEIYSEKGQGRDGMRGPSVSSPAGLIARFVERKVWREWLTGRWTELVTQIRTLHIEKLPPWVDSSDPPDHLRCGLDLEVTVNVPVTKIWNARTTFVDELKEEYPGMDSGDLGLEGVTSWDSYVGKMYTIDGKTFDEVANLPRVVKKVDRVEFGYGHTS